MHRKPFPRWAGRSDVLVALAAVCLGAWFSACSPRPGPGLIVVMDPLAKSLACSCVKGYAQRDYAPLAVHLSQRLQRPLQLRYAEDLDKVLRAEDPARIVLIIGKRSVVAADTRAAGFEAQPLARLTGLDGRTTLTGLFVVRAADPVKSLAELKGRRILFGLPDADEKHAAALAALRAAGVPLPGNPETRAGCSDAALEVQDCKTDPAPAAVVSSYALPLLEGCGSVEKGSLRVLAETAPVPFVTAFSSASLPPETRSRLTAALLAVGESPPLLKALESKSGFVADDTPAVAGEWSGWRGPARDGRVARLPETLPSSVRFLWRKPLTGAGLAGLAATAKLVVVAGRDLPDERDVFLGLRADTGEQVWRFDYPAAGMLDYGQSPRATPVIHGGLVHLLGAFGQLHCVSLADGRLVWKKNLVTDFGARLPKWGTCSTPLLVGDTLIVNPGAPKASLAALDRTSGRVLWTTPGEPAAYGSFIAGRFGGRDQVVGYDAVSLGGWDVRTGERIWKLTPPMTGDFNVPTPIAWEGRLIVATENNGTRLFGFGHDGRIVPQPIAEFAGLAPDVTTPVVANGRLFGCQGQLHCLELATNLKPLWSGPDPGFEAFASLIASDRRVLVATHDGELLLVPADAAHFEVGSRLRVFDAKSEIYSHPALVGDRLYWRDAASVACLSLGGSPTPSEPGAVAAR